MKKFISIFITLIVCIKIAAAQSSFNLPGDGKWYRVATIGGQHADFQYVYYQGTPNNPSVATGEIEFINAQNFMVQHHQTMGYSQWNQPQFALINLGNTSEIWVKATYGVYTGIFTITRNLNAALNLGDISDADLSDNGGVLTICDKLKDNSQINYSDILIPGNSMAIGAGNIDPNYKLAVKGKIHAQAVQVDLINWPDYVFKQTYTLPTLTQVKTYIDQNHHLPDMPSESEVAKNGLNLGEINALLTKKIEELTLYQIEQEEKSKKQEMRIGALEKALLKLTDIK